jgi:hypothetical protein
MSPVVRIVIAGGCVTAYLGICTFVIGLCKAAQRADEQMHHELEELAEEAKLN